MVSASSSIKWRQRFEATGSFAEKPGKKSRPSPLDDHGEWLLALVASEPDLTLAGIEARLPAERQFKTTDSSIARCFQRRRVSYKKTLHASEQHRADVAEAREAWIEAQPTLDRARLVFIDKTSTNTQMTRLRGRWALGKRLVDYTPHGHWKTTAFVAGLRSDAIVAPLVVDRPMNGTIFQALSRLSRLVIFHCPW
jgi:transposase